MRSRETLPLFSLSTHDSMRLKISEDIAGRCVNGLAVHGHVPRSKPSEQSLHAFEDAAEISFDGAMSHAWLLHFCFRLNAWRATSFFIYLPRGGGKVASSRADACREMERCIKLCIVSPIWAKWETGAPTIDNPHGKWNDRPIAGWSVPQMCASCCYAILRPTQFTHCHRKKDKRIQRKQLCYRME